MANTPDPGTCLATVDGLGELLPLSPFKALHYHFGMLLGVDDFETEQAYHRAKMRLHNAWLHREGVVWGFDVKLDQTRGEIRVTPGLALDSAGHELHLEGEACLNLGEWFDKHKQDPEFTFTTAGADTTFDAHVVIRFKACLTRQVPALMEPCDNAGTGTAYSRVAETVEILLLPNKSPERFYPYHRLRLLFGLGLPKQKEHSSGVTDDDQAVLDAVSIIPSLSAAQQAAAWLAAFHRFAALDEIDLRPASSEDGARTLLFPGRDDDPVVLADITSIKLTRQNNGWMVSGGAVDTSVRQSHVATTTIQDLLCRMQGGGPGAGAVTLGPRVDPSSVVISGDGKQITLKVDKPLLPSSVKADAFAVTVFSTDSSNTRIRFPLQADLDPDGRTVKLTVLPTGLGSGLVRILVRGTGTVPLLGADRSPLAGGTDAAPAPQGTDYVRLIERT
jgi:hypothetical protein